MQPLPLAGEHEALGATWGDVGGWRAPLHYGDPAAEQRAARAAAAVLDRSMRARIDVRGPDALTFLDGVLTNDLKTLEKGHGFYALTLDHRGRIHGAYSVFSGGGEYLLESEPDAERRALAYLERLVVSEDVALTDATLRTASLAFLGPGSAGLVGGLLGTAAPAEPYAFVAVPGRPGWTVARIPDFGGDAFEVWVPPDEAAELLRRAREGGARPIGAIAADALRVEAGRPAFPADLNEETLALEAPIEGAISLTKGCYVGQEAVSRATYVGQVNRLLIGFEVESEVPPDPGAEILFEGRVVGRVTSAVRSAHLGKTIGLGYVRRELAEPGTPVGVGEFAARIAALPFVR
ncbi:MAG TPA: aminomethyltransferase family protein [Thermoplasmata archaeon]|jgi:folate-binding protein YgfZ|nr:aminomethyltransferase family protein [Thermoplasmata archaeon]